jgi:class 3 adenylate cyclase
MIFMSEATRSMLTREQPDLVNAGDLVVRGRQLHVTVWSIDGSNGRG